MTVLVTGAAGFIGMHVAAALLARGERVVGFDDLNDYYDVSLKRARLAELEKRGDFAVGILDIADSEAVSQGLARYPDIDRIVHLAAQAGVRYSLTHPEAYIHTNLTGHGVILEAARGLENCRHLVYASSSSVYGSNRKLPFSVGDPVDRPNSLYAATKRADELMSWCYSHLYRVPMTGLRFFTVYGPWGRPDMAAWIFTERIFAGESIPVFNNGKMKRDFTWIDDITDGVLAALDRPPEDTGAEPPHRLYNLGNHRSEPLLRFIEVLEEAIGRKAKKEFLPIQPGDVPETFADIADSQRDLGFEPRVTIAAGIPRFVDWYRDWRGIGG